MNEITFLFLIASAIFILALTLAITGVQKQSEAALLHVRVDGVVRPQSFGVDRE